MTGPATKAAVSFVFHCLVVCVAVIAGFIAHLKWAGYTGPAVVALVIVLCEGVPYMLQRSRR